jgi:hypothetical protein
MEGRRSSDVIKQSTFPRTRRLMLSNSQGEGGGD